MRAEATKPSHLRFGVFELDLTTGELRKAGVLIHLPPQPFKILALLASRPGQLVTRDDIQQQVWGSETFVDFEHGLNFAIKKIREALGDEAETPRYVETLPRRGYRFIYPVDSLTPGPSPDGRGEPELASSPQPSPAGERVPRPVGAGEGTPPLQDVGADGVRPLEEPATTKGTRRVPLQKRWTVAAIGMLAVIVAVLLALNVGGLRERILAIGGGSQTRPRAGHRPAPTKDPIHRRPAAREPLWRQGAGIFRRRHDGRTDHRAGSNRFAARDFANLDDALQGRQEAATRDRARAER